MAEILAAWMALDDRQAAPPASVPERTPAAILLRRWQQGNPSAFDDLVAALHPMIFRVAFRLLGSRADAEDAVQETLLRLYRAGRGIRNPASLESWVYRSTVNAVRGRQARAAHRHLPFTGLTLGRRVSGAGSKTQHIEEKSGSFLEAGFMGSIAPR